MLPKFAYKFWKVYDRFFDGTKPGLPGAIPATKYFSQIIIISIIGIYKNGIIFYNLQVRLYNRLNWPMKSMYKFSLFTLLNLISVN